jgi:hypothetical protein
MKKSLLLTPTSLLLCAAAMTLSSGALAQTNGTQPKTTSLEAAEIRTPKAPATPRINGPEIFGVRPGNPFLYHIPATGDRPITFSASDLP